MRAAPHAWPRIVALLILGAVPAIVVALTMGLAMTATVVAGQARGALLALTAVGVLTGRL